MVARELALIKVNASGAARGELLEIVRIFNARVVDVDKRTLTIEAASSPNKLRALEEMLLPYGVIEVVRTGIVGIARG
jgi:acetolactate synthase-1/3 small subunit